MNKKWGISELAEYKFVGYANSADRMGTNRIDIVKSNKTDNKI